MKKVSVLAAQAKESFPDHFETARLDRFSDWLRAKTAVAVCLRLKNKIRARKLTKLQENDAGYCRVSVNEIGMAELELISCHQREHFKEEIEILNKSKVNGEHSDRNDAKLQNKHMKKTSSLYRLDPYLDGNGIL